MTLLVVAAALLAGSMAQADVVTDWNITAGDIAVAAKLPPPPAYRAMAMVQSAVYEAVNAITKRYPLERVPLDAAPGASVEAAVAAANRATLLKLVPSQQAAIDSAYQTALSATAESPAKTAGLAVGDKAATAILALRADDGAAATESYRPPHDRWRLRADRHPGCPPLAAAQAVGDDQRRPIPPRTTPQPHQ
jgi:hypothetical protein